METEETGKERDKPKVVSVRWKGSASLICGVFAWMLAFMLVPPGFANIPPLLGAIFAVLGIAIGRHALKTDEWVLWIFAQAGVALCVGNIVFVVALIVF